MKTNRDVPLLAGAGSYRQAVQAVQAQQAAAFSAFASTTLVEGSENGRRNALKTSSRGLKCFFNFFVSIPAPPLLTTPL
jgi:hypothetical protein